MPNTERSFIESPTTVLLASDSSSCDQTPRTFRKYRSDLNTNVKSPCYSYVSSPLHIFGQENVVRRLLHEKMHISFVGAIQPACVIARQWIIAVLFKYLLPVP